MADIKLKNTQGIEQTYSGISVLQVPTTTSGVNASYSEVTWSNRNLLDNPWFTVNQRGVSSFSTNTYGVDRWKSGIGTFTISNNNIICPMDSALWQILESDLLASLDGKTLSVSIMFSDNTIVSGTLVYDNNSSTNQFFFNDYTTIGQCYFDVEKRFTYSVGVQKILKAVKLELGSVSTLKNDTVPNYAEELHKCQYYYWVGTISISPSHVNMHWLRTLVPITMHATPSITVNSISASIDGTGYTYTASDASAIKYQNAIYIHITTNETFSVHYGYDGFETNISLSADL